MVTEKKQERKAEFQQENIDKSELQMEIECRKIAQEELYRCSELFWTQAQFFLTLNSALVGVVGLVFVYLASTQFLIFFVSGFGIFVSIVWLFIGNRIACYREATEKYIEDEERKGKCGIGILLFQNEYLSRRDRTILQRFSSTRLMKTILPFGITLLWCGIFAFSVVLWFLGTGTIN